VNAYQPLFGSDLGLADVPEFQDIGGAIRVSDDGLHLVASF
jgi:hypothetical protein